MEKNTFHNMLAAFLLDDILKADMGFKSFLIESGVGADTGCGTGPLETTDKAKGVSVLHTAGKEMVSGLSLERMRG